MRIPILRPAIFCLALAGAINAQTSDQVRAVDDIPPAPVTDIRALNNGGQILLTWTPSVDDAQSFTVFGDGFVPTNGLSGYRVYRATQGTDPQLIATLAPGTAEFADPVAEAGVTYTYSVRPFDTDNETSPNIEPGSAADLARIVALGGGPPDVVVVARVKARMSFDVVVDVTDVAAVEQFSVNFVALLADVLQIDPRRITVTSVTQGSTIVDFEIADVESDDEAPAAAVALTRLLEIVADDTANEFASIGPVLAAVDQTVEEVIVIPLPQDADGNIILSWFTRGGSEVGFDDFFLFADNFGRAQGEEGYDATFDIVPNGQVDFDDFFRFADDFGTTIVNATDIQALLN